MEAVLEAEYGETEIGEDARFAHEGHCAENVLDGHLSRRRKAEVGVVRHDDATE